MSYDRLKNLFDSLFDDANVWHTVRNIVEKYDENTIYMLTNGLDNIAKNTKDRDAVFDAVKIIGKYDGRAAASVATELGYMAKNTKDRDAVLQMEKIFGTNKVVDVVRKYNDFYVVVVVHGLGCIASVTKDRDAVVEAAKIVGKFEGKSASAVASGLGSVAEKTKDRDAVLQMAELIGTDEIVNAVKKYDGDTASEIIYGLNRIAMTTKNKNILVGTIKIVGKFDGVAAAAIATKLGCLAKNTKDGDVVLQTAEMLETNEVIDAVGNFDGSTAYTLGKELINVVKETKDGNAVKDFVKSLSAVHERDPVTAELIIENIDTIRDLFEGKYKGILRYMTKRRDRESLYAITRLGRKYEISNFIKKIRMDEFGNKQAERLIKLAGYLDASLYLDLDVEVSENLQESYNAAEGSLRKYMVRMDIKDLEKGIKFAPWLKTKDKTVLKVLREKQVKKVGIAKTYALASENELPLDEMKKDVETCAKTTGIDVSVSGNLDSIGEMARKIMSEVDIKKDENIARDVMPKLNRILNKVYKGSKSLTLYINPSDIETQMEALQNICSCISPGSSYFHYTQEYLKNPNTFWVVIKEGNRSVGRATVFVGNDGKGNKRLARVSSVRSDIPVKEELVDNALKDYAREIGAEYMESGEMFVPRLAKAYDDYVYLPEIFPLKRRRKVKIKRMDEI